MGAEISAAISRGQQWRSWKSSDALSSVANMSTRKAKPTQADLRAAARLRELWKKRPQGVTQDHVAEALGGKTQGLVSQYMTGKIPLNYRACAAFAQVLGVDVADIRTDLIELGLARPGADGWYDIKGLNQPISLGGGAEGLDHVETHNLKFRAASLSRKGLNHEKCEVYYGDGDSMDPRIKDGDAILVDKTDTTPRDDTIFVIEWKGEYYAKRANIIDGIVYFESDNPEGDHHWRKPKRWDNPKDPIKILGRVRWIGSWED